MERLKISIIMTHEFLRGTTTSKTARNINSVFDSSVTAQQTVSNRLAKFHKGKFDLTNESRGPPRIKCQ